MGEELPIRKHPRLKEYDYSQCGPYFVTFCVEDRSEMLGKVVALPAGDGNSGSAGDGISDSVGDGNSGSVGDGISDSAGDGTPALRHAQPFVELTDLGLEVQKSIEFVHVNDRNVEIPHFVIMPNHVHMIVTLNTSGHDVGPGFHPRPTLQTIVGRIKSYTTKRWNEINGTKHMTFWQHSYHDRIIRNEEEYVKTYEYIDQNPIRWIEDKYFV